MSEMIKLNFPTRYSIGSVYLAPATQPESWELLQVPQGLVTKPENQPINWDWLDDARSTLTIPANSKVKLKINNSASTRLDCLSELPPDSIHTLDVSRTGVTDESIPLIMHLKQLKVLELAYTAISDEGAMLFSKLENLHTLGLTHAAITNTGLREICKLTDLRELWLNGTLVDDEGMVQVKQLDKLVLLGLSSTRVTSEGLAELYNLKGLLRLYMFNTSLDEKTADEFRQNVKQCRVKWKRPAAQRPEFMFADEASLSLDDEFDADHEVENGSNGKARHVKPMNDDRFWQLVDLFNWDEEGNDTKVIEPCVDALSALTDEDICGFQETLHDKLFQLDAEKYARHIGRESYRSQQEYFSKSWFLNVRCCAIANGEDLFDDIVDTAENMPKDLGFRAICRVAPEAYYKKTGQKLTYSPTKSSETFSNRAGWPGMLETKS
ncbi:MAG: DUF4240 domain-containing protein [Candidatus Melainabacteria bacterium]|nr:DUF4240 domain-containing protein [Candidatus Melainabacteria bacterium]